MLEGRKRRRIFDALLVFAVAIVFGCGGGGGGGTPVSDPASGVFAGSVLDDEGNPVAGARVSIGGVEVEVAVLRPGHEPEVQVWPVRDAGIRGGIDLTRPTGGPPGSHSLRDFLVSEYEDAVELRGVDTFRVVDPLGLGGGVTVQVDFVVSNVLGRVDALECSD